MQRTYCGEVNINQLNQEVLVKGWIKKIRKLGNLVFLDLSDKTGLVQIVVSESNKFFNDVKFLSRESVIGVNGRLKKRVQDNKEIKTGVFEIELIDLEIYSVSKTPPMIIEQKTDALEEVRMKYRYLDLRRPNIQEIFNFRSHLLHEIRNFLISKKFMEVETPILGKPTPEGARDYLVPSRLETGCFYALPQSPQIYKQLLMVAGFDRYFQVTKCFRDEDLRSDRQPEFTQLDLELSFTNESEIQSLIEELMIKIFQNILKINLTAPFLRMDYEEAMNEYGSDKPDLRFGFKLQDFSKIFSNTKFNLFKVALENNHVIKAIVVDDVIFDKKQLLQLEKTAKDNKAKGLAWLSLDNGIWSGSIAKHLEEDILQVLQNKFFNKKGTILFSAEKLTITNKILGAIRNNLGTILNLKLANDFKFLWVVNWPLFEYDEEQNRYVAAHHPFTQPQIQNHNDFDQDFENAKARSYDIVLNGVELGGGSIRIIDPSMQDRMFKAVGLDDLEIANKFSFLIDAFKYGVPPHGGIALGLDRFIQLVLNLDSIKECIAFPKNNQAVDPLMNAPNTVNPEALETLKIKIIK